MDSDRVKNPSAPVTGRASGAGRLALPLLALPLLAALVLLPACQRSGPGPEPSGEQVRSALTANGNRILDFEAPAVDWTVAQGTAPAPTASTIHTHGAFSLALRPSGFVVIRSAAFPVAAAITGPFTFDLFLPTAQPNPNWFGAAQLYLDCPSKSMFNAFVAQQELTGRPTGQFRATTFALPSALASQLTAGCPDFSLRISLNVPSNATGTYLIDNLRFGGSGNQVRATFNCVARRTDTLFTAYFGYTNLENQVATIPVGPDNTISPAPADRKQPTIFEAGSHKTAAAVDFAPGTTVSWHLTAGTASANANSTVCPGSVPTPVRCPGVPASAADGCVTVIELPNPHGPDRDPAANGRPFDPSTLPAPGPIDPDEADEAAIQDFHWFPITTVTIAPGVTQTFNLPVSESSVAVASATWSSPGQQVALSLQMGSTVVVGAAVDRGAQGGAANARGAFTGAGTIQAVLKNTGSTPVTARVVTGVVASSKAQ